MAVRRLFARLPALLGAAVIALGASQIIWNGTVGQLVPRLHWHVKIPLGATPDHPPPLSLAALLDGAWQRQVAHAVGPRTILYRLSVRWKSQFYYSVFGTSGGQEVGVGPARELFQWIYVQAYCRGDVAGMRRAAPEAAARLRALQDRLTASGQDFLYVLTPSKVAQNPWIIPPGYPCPHGNEAPARRLAWTEALRREGVHQVDTALRLEQARARYPVPLFARGGIHWDALGAALGAQALTGAADAQGGRLTPFSFSVAVGSRPLGADRDLYDMLNLVAHDDHYPVPLLRFQSTAPVPCRPQRIAEVAGSFMFRLNETLEAAACPPEIRLYWYWDHGVFVYADGGWRQEAVDPARRAEDLLRWAELVILEENEAMIAASPHAAELARMMAAQVNAAR
jgi:hypothetical protein